MEIGKRFSQAPEEKSDVHKQFIESVGLQKKLFDLCKNSTVNNKFSTVWSNILV